MVHFCQQQFCLITGECFAGRIHTFVEYGKPCQQPICQQNNIPSNMARISSIINRLLRCYLRCQYCVKNDLTKGYRPLNAC